MEDLANALIEASGKVIREKHDADSRSDFATMLVVTDRDGVIEVHRFDINNRRNGTVEKRAAIDCRRGADRFMDLELGTTDSPLQSRWPERPGPSFHWVFISTSTKNVAKDVALRDQFTLDAIDHPAVDRFVLAFTGHTRLPERRITLKPEENHAAPLIQ